MAVPFYNRNFERTARPDLHFQKHCIFGISWPVRRRSAIYGSLATLVSSSVHEVAPKPSVGKAHVPNHFAPRGRAGQPGPRAENRERGQSLPHHGRRHVRGAHASDQADRPASFVASAAVQDHRFARPERPWCKSLFVPRSPEPSAAPIGTAQPGLDPGAIDRHKLIKIQRLRSSGHRSKVAGARRKFRSISTAKPWHKSVQKCATLCHFRASIHGPFPRSVCTGAGPRRRGQGTCSHVRNASFEPRLACWQQRDRKGMLGGNYRKNAPRTGGGLFLSTEQPAVRSDREPPRWSRAREPKPMPAYHPQRIEPKWQAEWERNKTFRAIDLDPSRPKLYILDMFPYPSGAGLHVGHPEGYTATDIVCRYKRMRGFNVLHPMGWDAFGLPAEQYAVQTNTHPRITTQANIDTFRRQIKSLGFSYDWDREVDTTDPDYYKWTQWIFLQDLRHLVRPRLRVDRSPGQAAQGQGPADRRAADPAGHRRSRRLSRLAAARLPRRGPGQLVPGAGHRAGQRGSHRRQERARRVSGRAHAADPVDAADHRLRRAAGRRPRRRRLAPPDQGHAAQLGRPQRGGRGRFPDRGRAARPRSIRVLHDPPRHAFRRDLHGARARASAGRPAHDRRRSDRVSTPTARPPRARATSTAPTWPRPRPASSPALTPSTRSTASRSRSGSPTTC